MLAALLFDIVLAAAAPTPEALQRAEVQLASAELADWEAARGTFEAALEAAPDSYPTMLKVATALTQIMSGRSGGGGFGIDGISNREADRQICAQLGPRASELADRAAALHPDDIHALFVRSVAYGYYAASFGIIEAIARGTVGTIKRNAQAIVDRDGQFDGGVGFFMLGVFNTLAPWPVGSNSDANDYFTLALQADPRSKRNNYGMAVLQWRRGARAAARAGFTKAAELPCGAPVERPLCDFYTRESRRVLALAHDD